MNHGKKAILMIGADDMLERLMEVSDDAEYVNNVYPQLMMLAEQYVPVEQFNVLLLTMLRLHTPQQKWQWMMDKIPEFIFALVDDPQIATWMIDVHKCAQEHVRQQACTA